MDIVAAAKARRFGLVVEMLKTGADPNHKNRFGEVALHWAVIHGHDAAVDALLAAGGQPTPKTTSKRAAGNGASGATPLHFAACGGHIHIMRLLIRAGADVNARDALGVTPLIAAVSSPYLEALRLLVASGADPNNDAPGYTALHIAARDRDVTTVQTLLELGASPQPRPGDEFPPLRLAIAFGRTDIVQVLLQAGATMNRGGA